MLLRRNVHAGVVRSPGRRDVRALGSRDVRAVHRALGRVRVWSTVGAPVTGWGQSLGDCWAGGCYCCGGEPGAVSSRQHVPRCSSSIWYSCLMSVRPEEPPTACCFWLASSPAASGGSAAGFLRCPCPCPCGPALLHRRRAPPPGLPAAPARGLLGAGPRAAAACMSRPARKRRWRWPRPPAAWARPLLAAPGDSGPAKPIRGSSAAGLLPAAVRGGPRGGRAHGRSLCYYTAARARVGAAARPMLAATLLLPPAVASPQRLHAKSCWRGTLPDCSFRPCQAGPHSSRSAPPRASRHACLRGARAGRRAGNQRGARLGGIGGVGLCGLGRKLVCAGWAGCRVASGCPSSTARGAAAGDRRRATRQRPGLLLLPGWALRPLWLGVIRAHAARRGAPGPQLGAGPCASRGWMAWTAQQPAGWLLAGPRAGQELRAFVMWQGAQPGVHGVTRGC
jgi:hypothetical protein